MNRNIKSSGTGIDKSNLPSGRGKEGSPVRRGSNAPLPAYIIDSSSESGLKPSNVVGNIQFQNVSFAYPTRRETRVFEDFTLNVEPGTTVALVGPRYVAETLGDAVSNRWSTPNSRLSCSS